MARRDEIVAFANQLLDLDAWPDYGPMGMQVVGADEVRRIACGVSASLELFERSAEAGAQLLLVHHGLFLNKRPTVVDVRLRRRLETLFRSDLTLVAYHLALDAHLDVGNNACLARELGVEVEQRFGDIGLGGRLGQPLAIEEFVDQVRARVAPQPLVFACGPGVVARVAISSGKAGHELAEAARQGYEVFLTGEPEEESLHLARELGVHFIAAGHYATERFGVQALARRLADRFDVAWEFVEVPNPV